MKSIVIGLGAFALGLSVGAAIAVPRHFIGPELVERCRAEVRGMDELPPEIREAADRQRNASKAATTRWKIVQAIARIDA